MLPVFTSLPGEDEPEEAPEPDVAEQAPLQAADPGAPAPRGRAPRAARAPRAPRARRAPVNQGQGTATAMWSFSWELHPIIEPIDLIGIMSHEAACEVVATLD